MLSPLKGDAPRGAVAMAACTGAAAPGRSRPRPLSRHGRRIAGASGSLPVAVLPDLAGLALSPQCGFSSTVEGNKVSEDDQVRKLGLVVQVAHEVWG